MTELKRTMSAGITEEHCLTLDEVARHAADGSLQDYLLPVDRAVEHLPAHTVAAEKVKAALQGQRLSSAVVSPAVQRGETLRLYSPERQFLGIFRVEEETMAVKAVKVFLPE